MFSYKGRREKMESVQLPPSYTRTDFSDKYIHRIPSIYIGIPYYRNYKPKPYKCSLRPLDLSGQSVSQSLILHAFSQYSSR
jgi:hypothetical protein